MKIKPIKFLLEFLNRNYIKLFLNFNQLFFSYLTINTTINLFTISLLKKRYPQVNL